jgi:hypothetical protein
MAKSGEFYSFDEVLRKMSIDEQRLKKLVSEGEIRAFREGSEMRFRRSDIDSMSHTRPIGGGEDATAAIDLSAGGGRRTSETLTDDLIFDEGDDLADHETGMATAEISSHDTFIDEGSPGMSTEPLDVDGDRTMETSPAGGRKPANRSAGASQPARAPARVVEEEPTSIGWSLVLVLSAAALIMGCMVAWDIGRVDRQGQSSGGLSQWVGETLGSVKPHGAAK